MQVETFLLTISVTFLLSLLLHLTVEQPILNTLRELFDEKLEKKFAKPPTDENQSDIRLRSFVAKTC